ncbi:MAG: dienelactone hydrolase family protein [Parachlamydiales bacterium]|jgi:phospholipase/carboxylesterase
MPPLEIVSTGTALDKASKALILLHGRGASAQDILSLAEDFADEQFYVAAPQAPNHSWYPYSFMEEEKSNEPYLSASIVNIKKLIDDIHVHIPKNQIYIMGFSQGACLTLEVTSRFADTYGGVVAFTGGLIGLTLNENKYQGSFDGTKVFIGNSDRDPHVPLIRSQHSKEIMEKLGAHVTLKVYRGMAHTINEDEISWVKENIFLNP